MIDKALRLTDGNGLYPEVKPKGSKLWRYRYRIEGKENLYALSEYPTMSLQDARKAREGVRELVKQGIRPSHARRATTAKQIGDNANTFKAVAEEWIERN